MHLPIFLVTYALCFKVVNSIYHCATSAQTVTNVSCCPKNEMEWRRAAAEKECWTIEHNCTKSLEYHCVPTEDVGVFVEVCAAIFRNLYGVCTEWNTLGEIIQPSWLRDCAASLNPCSPPYLSNETFEYSICYETNNTCTEQSQKQVYDPKNSTATIAGVTAAMLMLFVIVVINFMSF
ncbi:uncharacterized protein LOC134234097 [Saccostrea cucullata]|uniref:uncharacterized protein LOC134234097 n=1 Tax=Saccostrea cuccullata TaxID=36930 RepID=UPI002ED5364D